MTASSKIMFPPSIPTLIFGGIPTSGATSILGAVELRVRLHAELNKSTVYHSQGPTGGLGYSTAFASDKEQGLRPRALNLEEELLLTEFQIGNISFDASDLFDQVDDAVAIHNNLPPEFADTGRTESDSAPVTPNRENILRLQTPLSSLSPSQSPPIQRIQSQADPSPTMSTEVLENYPDAQQAPEANEAELTKIVDKYKKSGIDGTRELAKYHREFVAVATALKNQGTMSAVQVAKAYVRVLPDGLKNRLETRLQVQIPTKQKGIAYTLPQIRSAIEFLISDASTPFATEDFRVGVHSVVPEQKKTYATPKADHKPKEEPEDTVVSHLTKQLLALTQVVNKMVDGQSFKPFDPSISSTDSQARKPKLCYWDGCPARTMNDCPDLAEWVRNGTVERNARGHVVLKGGGRLPDEERFNRGPIKQRFEKYFEEYPAARALILDIPSNQDEGPNRQLGEPDFAVSTHTTYTLNGYQGPSMLASAASYLVQDESDNTAINKIKEMIYKMETRRSANDQSKNAKGRTDTKADSSNNDTSQYPQPAQTFDELGNDEQAALVVELDEQRLNPDLLNLQECWRGDVELRVRLHAELNKSTVYHSQGPTGGLGYSTAFASDKEYRLRI
ncbi:hypothetical protein F5050DRAFT_1709753 [Lentinula boryana]|uniref:Uncharacterized protein n=1 Tax=Lentinula boryana TaxID=40481 RepID=A0ABQ8QLK1_9AGAR|nr:hypothetical protein F5050DRAFT_1709753 [Lentinula boryana]